MTAEPVSRTWRRYARFSVRGLIVLVLLIGGGLGWIVRCARIQREAVAAIESAHGRVEYDWQWTDGKAIQGGKPWAPRWLVNLMGVDYFGCITRVELIGTANDAALVQVGRLARLEHLNLWDSSVSDTGLAHLQGLTELSHFDLRFTPVTDLGLEHLKGLTNLRQLANCPALRSPILGWRI